MCAVINQECERQGARLVCYVHNLSFEFQFLAGQVDIDEVFAVDSRKPVRVLSGSVEYRCSYYLTNMSLAAATTKYCKKWQKLDGEDYDYSKYRDSNTSLTITELRYCINDVLSVCELVNVLMHDEADTLDTVPMTNTGYLRREARGALHKRRRQLANLCPEPDVYGALREAFRGGNVHANRYYATQILEHVKSADRSSSYPDVLCNDKYPMGAFKRADSGAWSKYLDGGAAILLRVRLVDVSVLPWVTVPYISVAKCRRIPRDIVADNGRVLYASTLDTTVTDIDLRILLRQYKIGSIEPLDMWVSYYDVLPPEYIGLNIKYFKAKTELKGVDGQELYYMKSKNRLNSFYGMSAQDPVKGAIIYNGNWIREHADVAAELAKYKRKGFLPYQWGVWCTAWARDKLQWGIDAAGDGFVYADTDSVKYMGDVDFSAFNAQSKERSIASGAYATDKKGITHYMGVYEQEQTADKFVTLGAKRYCYEIGGALHLTCSGVNKVKGARELEQLGGIEAFRDGVIFRDAGRTIAYYNDDAPQNVYIENSEYHLSIGNDYRQLLDALFGVGVDIDYYDKE